MAGNTVKLNKDAAPFPGSPWPVYDNDGYLIGWENQRGGKLTFVPASDWILGLTASVTQTQAGGLALDYKNIEVDTVGTGGDALTLPFGQEGMKMIVRNNAAANAMAVFPASGQAINALGNDNSMSIAANKTVYFHYTGGKWATILTA